MPEPQALSFSFILVEPATAENVGSAARAMKTMGFADMRLVNPQCDYRQTCARHLAYGSTDVLLRAHESATLAEASRDLDFLVGTASLCRHIYKTPRDLADLPSLLQQAGPSIKKVGLVFGRESRGLTNDELSQCDLVAAVPMATTFPTINLAQSVMLFAYTMSRCELAQRPQRQADPMQYQATKRNVANLLQCIGIQRSNRSWNRLMDVLASLSYPDLQLVNYLFHKAKPKLGLANPGPLTPALRSAKHPQS